MTALSTHVTSGCLRIPGIPGGVAAHEASDERKAKAQRRQAMDDAKMVCGAHGMKGSK